MSTGNFLSSIETALGPVRNALGPVRNALGPVRDGVMRNVTPQALAKNPKMLRYLQGLKAAGGANPVILAALQAYQAYQIAEMGDEGRQDMTDEAYENPDEKNIVETIVGSVLNAPKAIYKAGRAMADMSESVAGELESEKALGEAEKKAAEKAESRSKKKKDTPSEDQELTESEKALLFELGVGDGVAEEKSLSDYEKEDMQRGAIEEAVSELGEKAPAAKTDAPAKPEKLEILDAHPDTKLDSDDAWEAGSAPPEVDYSADAIELFQNTHGTSFDTKSSMDRGKLEDMKVTLANNKGKKLTPDQFALQYYREFVL